MSEVEKFPYIDPDTNLAERIIKVERSILDLKAIVLDRLISAPPPADDTSELQEMLCDAYEFLLHLRCGAAVNMADEQSVLARLRDSIAALTDRNPNDVQDEFEAKVRRHIRTRFETPLVSRSGSRND